jgi:hypothetical protein
LAIFDASGGGYIKVGNFAPSGLIPDLNNDGIVNLDDLAILTNYWLKED